MWYLQSRNPLPTAPTPNPHALIRAHGQQPALCHTHLGTAGKLRPFCRQADHGVCWGRLSDPEVSPMRVSPARPHFPSHDLPGRRGLESVFLSICVSVCPGRRAAKERGGQMHPLSLIGTRRAEGPRERLGGSFRPSAVRGRREEVAGSTWSQADRQSLSFPSPSRPTWDKPPIAPATP